MHGAWHQPSTWDLLRAELDALGRPSVTVKLPTAGPDPRGGLREDAAAVRAAWHTVPSAYVITEQDRSPAVELQERMAGRAKVVHRLPTSHSPFLSRPAELAALLDSIATDLDPVVTTG